MKDIPTKFQKMYDRRKTSRKAAIRFFCLECMGYNEKDIPGCTDKSCPLFRWRLSG